LIKSRKGIKEERPMSWNSMLLAIAGGIFLILVWFELFLLPILQ
jgi:hypothetical protein